MKGPTHQHDCDACEYVDSYQGVDWYVCPDKSVVGRRSSDGPDYWSMPIDMLQSVVGASNVVCFELAIAQEVLKTWGLRESLREKR